MKDDQLTLRLPRALSHSLAARARDRGVSKSVLVREAIEAYLAGISLPDPTATWDRLVPFIGAAVPDRAEAERDALARTVREHNRRD